MRCGLIADVHANLPALQAVLAAGRAAGVERWLCAGDLVGYGPSPNECVEVLADVGALSVAGNHELLALGHLDGRRSGRLARQTTPWTREALRDDVRDHLAALPLVARSGSVLVAHGGLDDPERYVTTAAGASAELRRAEADHPGVDLLVLGHTHRPLLADAGIEVPASSAGTSGRDGRGGRTAWRGALVVNPGSVGQSRQRERRPLARFAIADLEHRRVELRAVAYDVAAARTALREHHLPATCLHVHPGAVPTLTRRVGRVLGAVPVIRP